MNTNLIYCLLSMLVGVIATVLWYEHDYKKRMAYTIYRFKWNTNYALKNAVYRVVAEDEDLRYFVFKESFFKGKEIIDKDFADDFHYLVSKDASWYLELYEKEERL